MTARLRGIQPYRAVHATFAGEGGLFGRQPVAATAPIFIIWKGGPTLGLDD